MAVSPPFVCPAFQPAEVCDWRGLWFLKVEIRILNYVYKCASKTDRILSWSPVQWTELWRNPKGPPESCASKWTNVIKTSWFPLIRFMLQWWWWWTMWLYSDLKSSGSHSGLCPPADKRAFPSRTHGGEGDADLQTCRPEAGRGVIHGH